MDDTSLVHRVDHAGPMTHALVIGVGRYRHLEAGGGSLFEKATGMHQLSSPPISARRFVEWLINPENRCDLTAPLGSVRLLLSEEQSGLRKRVFRNKATGKRIVVPEPTYEAVQAAIDECVEDLNCNESNVGLFFFSGHGVENGTLVYLLLSDFGREKRPRTPAIRFRDMRNALSQVAARSIFFFVDACREGSAVFGDDNTLHGYHFVDIRETKDVPHSLLDHSTLYATMRDLSAYSFPDKPSLFTQALLTALEGGGAIEDESGEHWQLRPPQLLDATHQILNRELERIKRTGLQKASNDELGGRPLGTFRSPPRVQVELVCYPKAAGDHARVSCDARKVWKPGSAYPLIEVGYRHFEASFARSGYARATTDMDIRPPIKTVKLATRPS